MIRWLSPELKEDIRIVFEPIYSRLLSEEEVIEIARNLTSVVEVYAKNEYERTQK